MFSWVAAALIKMKSNIFYPISDDALHFSLYRHRFVDTPYAYVGDVPHLWGQLREGYLGAPALLKDV